MIAASMASCRAADPDTLDLSLVLSTLCGRTKHERSSKYSIENNEYHHYPHNIIGCQSYTGSAGQGQTASAIPIPFFKVP